MGKPYNKTMTKQEYIDLANKEYKKVLLLDFLKWMNRTAKKNPMALETTADDIIEMYINKTYK